MPQIYLAGYSKRQIEDFAIASRHLNAMVVDIRLSALSRVPQWDGKAMANYLGDSYVHVPELGNLNYKGGDIRIANPSAGVNKLRQLFTFKPAIILLCCCYEMETCHRKVVGELMADDGYEVTPLDWEEVFPSPQQSLFAVS